MSSSRRCEHPGSWFVGSCARSKDTNHLTHWCRAFMLSRAGAGLALMALRRPCFDCFRGRHSECCQAISTTE